MLEEINEIHCEYDSDKAQAHRVALDDEAERLYNEVRIEFVCDREWYADEVDAATLYFENFDSDTAQARRDLENEAAAEFYDEGRRQIIGDDEWYAQALND
jgi:hypothetical protein